MQGGGGGVSRGLRGQSISIPLEGLLRGEKKDGISLPIKKRVTSLPTLSLEKYHECVRVWSSAATESPANELTESIDC